MSITWGYTLSSEEHDPRALVRQAVQAEELGFDFLSISDHFHPWVDRQGQSPFVWSTIGGVAASTSRIRLGVGVTCPIIRIHPAIVAQAAATSAVMLGEGRFFLGVGTGELLNEHITGERWPNIEERQDMLEEAVEVMRSLWTGEQIDHIGPHYAVHNARLYTCPAEPPPVVVSAMGPSSARLAARIGDGLWTTSPDDQVLATFRDEGGTGPLIGQLTLCWGEDADRAASTAHEIWPNAGVPGQLSQELPTPTLFEQAATLVTKDMIASMMPCGPDPGPVLEKIAAYRDAGFDHVHVHQIGPDQDGFFRFWSEQIQPKL